MNFPPVSDLESKKMLFPIQLSLRLAIEIGDMWQGITTSWGGHTVL